MHERVQRGFRAWTLWIARRRLRQMDRVDIAGLDGLRDALTKGSVVAAANHVCWWDAMVLMNLSDRLGVDFHVMIDQPSMERYPFFRAAGGIGVSRTSGAASRRGLREAQARLDVPGTLLWVFPQGRYTPTHRRPLGIEGGAAFLAKRSNAPLVPVSISYPYLQGEAPAVFVTVGAPSQADDLEASLIAGLDSNDVRAEAQRFALIAEPDFAARCLAWVVGALGG